MFPSVGDSVKFTNNFLNNSPLSWTSPYKDVELEVLSIKLASMASFPIYSVFIMSDSLMLNINIDKLGRYVDEYDQISSLIVFEDYYGSPSFSYSSPYSAPIYAPSPHAWNPAPSTKAPLSEDDRCKKCGTMGDVRGMCCMCPSCGHTIWGA